jgi:maltose O-acetyltransferase
VLQVPTTPKPRRRLETAEHEPAPSSRGTYYVSRMREYATLFRRSLHLRLTVANTVCGLLPNVFSAAIRGRVYRRIGFRIGQRAFFMGNLRLTGASPGFYDNLVVDSDVMISEHVTVNLDGRVTIGRNVSIGPKVVIYTATHRIGPGSRRLGALESLPVTIEDGAWVRLGAVIVPGVTIGRGSIIAAGAVVLHDVPPNTYVEGNPASVVRRLGWANR